MSEIKITPFSPEWEASHKVFATEYFKGKRKRINPDYIYWKFRGNSEQPMSSFLLAIADKKVIGQIGLVPAQVVVGNDVYDAQWICEIMVHNDFRGFGVAKLLYEDALQRKITLGSDPSPAAAKSLARVGFKQIEGPWKFFLPLRLNAISDKKFKKASPLLKYFSNPIVLLMRANQFVSGRQKLTQITLEQIDWDWYKDQSLNQQPKIVHDLDFLNWRMTAFKDYHNEGLVFQEKNEYLLLSRVSANLCLVSEFIYKDVSTAKKVLRALVLFMQKSGVLEIKWLANNAIEESLLKSLGFFKFKTRTDIIYASQNEKFNRDMELQSHFYYTYLDSDENI